MDKKILRASLLKPLCSALLGIMLVAPAYATDHVVIMAISSYARSPLAGVMHDTKSALELAEKLGYDTTSPTILKDEQLTAQGMRRALKELAERIKTNDRLFFYYSGHGASSLVNNQCVSSLVTHDENYIGTVELKTYFDQMKGKVQDALIVMDACFSGGLQDLARTGSRSTTGSTFTGLVAKSWRPKAGEECDQPTNIARAWDVSTARGMSRSPENNFTFLAAASERQVALDDAGRGGLATVSLLQCARDGVPANGLATANQLAACAQKLVNDAVPRLNSQYNTRWTAHTLEVAGNKDRSLSTLRITPTVQPTANTNRAEQVKASLQQIANSGNGNWGFKVTPSVTSVRLSEPEQRRVVRFTYDSTQAGYGYILYVGTDGKDMKQLYPEPGENNFMPARGEFPALSIDPPAGSNTYLFVMSQIQRDFEGIFKTQGGDAIAEATAVQCELHTRNSSRVKVGNPCDDRRNSGRVRPAQISGELQGYASHTLEIKGF